MAVMGTFWLVAGACRTAPPKRVEPGPALRITAPVVRPEDAAYRLTLVRSREQTAERLGYRPEEGSIVRFEQLKVAPNSLKAAETLSVSGEYVVLGPDPNTPLTFRAHHEVFFVGQSWRRFSREITAPQGTYKLELPWRVPPDAAEGPYGFLIEVEMSGRPLLGSERALFTVFAEPLPAPRTPAPAPPSVPAPKTATVEVSVESARIRKGPSEESPVFATVPKGTRLELVEERPREPWGIKVNTPVGEPGWMQSRDVIIRR